MNQTADKKFDTIPTLADATIAAAEIDGSLFSQLMLAGFINMQKQKGRCNVLAIAANVPLANPYVSCCCVCGFCAFIQTRTP